MTAPAAAPIRELDVDGPAAPPRSNGELVFAEPWQGRAFGLVMALTERGVVSYDAFRDRLIQRIATGEAAASAGQDGDDYSGGYYAHWLQALEDVLADRSLVAPADLETRSAAFAGRPAGHDHRHDDGHDHHH